MWTSSSGALRAGALLGIRRVRIVPLGVDREGRSAGATRHPLARTCQVAITVVTSTLGLLSRGNHGGVQKRGRTMVGPRPLVNAPAGMVSLIVRQGRTVVRTENVSSVNGWTRAWAIAFWMHDSAAVPAAGPLILTESTRPFEPNTTVA